MNNIKIWEVVLILAGIFVTVFLIQNKTQVKGFFSTLTNKNSKSSDRILTDKEIERAYKEELAMVNKYRELSKNGKNEDMQNLARTLNSLGVTYSDMEKDKESIPCYDEALKIWDKLQINNDPKITYNQAMVLNNMAISQKNTDDFKGAERSYLEAINKCEKLIGLKTEECYFLTGITYQNLGDYYRYTKTGNSVDVTAYYTKAKDMLLLTERDDVKKNIIDGLQKYLDESADNAK